MNKLNKVIVCVDMAGCPNRCKHCWLGVTPNGKMEKEDLLFAANAFRPFTNQLEIVSWYREPDFRKDYRELWDLECQLSDVKTPHFELMSYWRMVRDKDYAGWLYSLGVRKCQLTLFGSEKTTDYYVGRKGAYREIIKSIDILLEHSIAPRIQVFINKDNINELYFIEELIYSLDLENRCKEIGQEFQLFIHQGSCDGENEKLYDIRITEDDLNKIPEKLAMFTLRHSRKCTLNEVFGKTERVLIEELSGDKSTISIVSSSPIFYIDANFDVFPNETQPTTWWCLGNLKLDGAKKIIDNYISNKSKAQHLINSIPIGEMVNFCGNLSSERLFTKGDYITYIQNQFCRINQ